MALDQWAHVKLIALFLLNKHWLISFIYPSPELRRTWWISRHLAQGKFVISENGSSGTHCKNTQPEKTAVFHDATTGFPAKWRVRKERRNSIPMTRHYPDDLDSDADWLKICFIQSIRRSAWCRVISMKFLRSFIRRHLFIYTGTSGWAWS